MKRFLLSAVTAAALAAPAGASDIGIGFGAGTRETVVDGEAASDLDAEIVAFYRDARPAFRIDARFAHHAHPKPGLTENGLTSTYTLDARGLVSIGKRIRAVAGGDATYFFSRGRSTEEGRQEPFRTGVGSALLGVGLFKEGFSGEYLLLAGGPGILASSDRTGGAVAHDAYPRATTLFAQFRKELSPEWSVEGTLSRSTSDMTTSGVPGDRTLTKVEAQFRREMSFGALFVGARYLRDAETGGIPVDAHSAHMPYEEFLLTIGYGL